MLKVKQMSENILFVHTFWASSEKSYIACCDLAGKVSTGFLYQIVHTLCFQIQDISTSCTHEVTVWFNTTIEMICTAEVGQFLDLTDLR